VLPPAQGFYLNGQALLYITSTTRCGGADTDGVAAGGRARRAARAVRQQDGPRRRRRGGLRARRARQAARRAARPACARDPPAEVYRSIIFILYDARWPRGQSVRRAITEAKQCS
jgi:hypothetical protein